MAQFAIAGLQLDLQKSGNLGLIERETRALAKRFGWIQMVVAPELAVHGPDPKNAEPEGGETEQRFQALARECGVWLIPGTMFQKRGGEVFNVAPVISPDGEIVARYAKMFPFLPYEEGVSAGSEYVVFDVPGAGRFGLSICYDMWFPETTRTLAAMGAQAIIHPSLTNTVDREVELSIARTNAAITQSYFLDINTAGALGNGRSGLYGPGGEVIYRAETGRDILAFEIDLAQADHVRRRGWHGLGQMMKSFRDSEAPFPVHAEGQRKTAPLAALGPLEKPEKIASEDTSQGEPRPAVAFRKSAGDN
ncbi:carbon-nitrogen hydrolase family protein [Euryhalocaulis caribicus]|uniref:carbon-nitrogen hydrolase family protein n=1 Tax=Euryhalocaulis caribicus TaxID=1161401 RepID=UPI0003A178EB|nr:carbon-nitrogen hydrolase family protein [Euryhalocaulis caribicus]